VVQAFEALGGDASAAIDRAHDFPTVGEWVAWQASQTAVVGAAALAVPVAHLPVLALDIGFLMHKMAWCSWGVGAILKCPVDPLPDLAVILGLWSGDIEEDALNAAYAAGVAGVAVGAAAGAAAYPNFAAKVAAASVKLGFLLAGPPPVTASVATKAAAKLGAMLGPQLASKIVLAASPHLAAAFSSKALSSAFTGILPFIGPVTGAGVNTWIMARIAKSADTYYRAKCKYLGIPPGDEPPPPPPLAYVPAYQPQPAATNPPPPPPRRSFFADLIDMLSDTDDMPIQRNYY
jgi:hypothetical protein